MDSDRRYYYDPETCSFVEIETTWKDRTRKAAMLLGAVLALTLLAAMAMDAGFVATPQEQALKAENQALQSQLQKANTQMTSLSTELNQLSKKDQRLYRRLLQIEPIPEDVRQVGVGGSDAYEAFDRFGTRTSNLLKSTAQSLDRLERQMGLQATSYRELERVAGLRNDEFLQLPAIRPANGTIVSGYGMRHHPILKVRKMHAGVDFLLRTGTPVTATADGEIRRASYSPTYGNYVDIYHKASNYMTRYAHLSEFADGIRRGTKVKRGDVIAMSGNTGRSTGPHLHYEVRDLSSKRTLDPMDFFVPDMTPRAFHELEVRTEMYEAKARGEEYPMDAGGEEGPTSESDDTRALPTVQ